MLLLNRLPEYGFELDPAVASAFGEAGRRKSKAPRSGALRPR